MRANQAGWVVFVGTIAVLDGACSGRLIVDRGPGSGGAGATASGGATSGAAGSAASAGSGAVASSGGSSGSGAGGAQGGSGGSFGSGGVGGTVVLPATGAGGLPPFPPPVCGGVQCKESEDCCLLTVKCFDKTERSACPAPSPDAGLAIACGGVSSPLCNPDAFTLCASNTDCAADSYCYGIGSGCAGPGFCEPRASCSGGTPSCACDGKTYANCQSLSLAGVRMQYLPGQSVPCGTTVRIGIASDSGTGMLSVTPCGFDSQCGSGEKCCAISGLCYDASRPVLCTEPPAGTSRPCETQADCLGYEFCDGPGCTGPGGCRPIGSVKCDPLLKAVCGCDGQNYGNASCAKNAGSRVASEGACPL
jgi:hypothetical protein